MSSVGTAQTALALALAALGKDGSGGGGSGGGTVSITVGTTTTGEPGTDAQVVNIGTSTDAIFNFVIPQGIPGVDGKDGVNGIDGIDGNMWYASNLTPGSIVSGAKDGDLILYNGGSVYQVKNGTPVNTQVSIQGSQWYFLTTPPSPNVPVGMQNGTILVFNDYSVWRITGGVLVNTGLNLKGPQGDAGFSPIIEVKEDTDESYVLTITNETGSFDTPNLKGSGGTGTGVSPYDYAV